MLFWILKGAGVEKWGVVRDAAPALGQADAALPTHTNWKNAGPWVESERQMYEWLPFKKYANTNMMCEKLSNVSLLSLASRAGVSKLWDLMPDDLRWNWCNHNRDNMHNKCNVLESSPNLPPPTQTVEKIVFQETGPWGQKGWGLLL